MFLLLLMQLKGVCGAASVPGLSTLPYTSRGQDTDAHSSL